MHRKMVFFALNAAFISLNVASKRNFFDFRRQIQRQNAKSKGQMHRKMVFMP